MRLKRQGLYDPFFEHDACGVGFVANTDGTKNHSIIEEGVTILKNLEHRGAVGGDQKSGDGAGMMLQIPDDFFRRACSFTLPPAGKYGVAFLFLPRDKNKKETAKQFTAKIIKQEGFSLLGWREVPVNAQSLGEFALKSIPSFLQVFVRLSNRDKSGTENEKSFFKLVIFCVKILESYCDQSNLFLTSICQV